MDLQGVAGRSRRAPRLAAAVTVAMGIAALGLTGLAGGAMAAVGPTDLSITKTDSPDPATVGNNVTYTITVTNTGANDASAVTVADALPADTD